jgi:hypothetical protein
VCKTCGIEFTPKDYRPREYCTKSCAGKAQVRKPVVRTQENAGSMVEEFLIRQMGKWIYVVYPSGIEIRAMVLEVDTHHCVCQPAEGSKVTCNYQEYDFKP